MAKPALRHRIALRPEVELEGVTADGVLDGVLAAVPSPGDPGRLVTSAPDADPSQFGA